MERYLDDQVALAQLQRVPERDRLSVHAETGVVVVADARLDNRVELRRLLARDAPARQAPDTALILEGYLRWGPGVLPRLVGDYALMVWDPRHRRLLLARDPMAMRALYYRVESDRVLVATEVKQILAVPGVPDEPDERMAAAYLAGCFGDLEWTYYRSVQQVAPSHAVMVTPDTVHRWRYWDVDPGRVVTHASEAEYAEHLREVFLEAVRARVTGNGRVGVFLSGGVDSGALASAAGWLNEREELQVDLRSYSWDFGSFTQCDERHLSRHIVERYGITATDVRVDDAGPLAGYPEQAPDLDDPFHGHFQTMLDRGMQQASTDGVGRLFTGMRGDLAVGPTDVDYRWLIEDRRGRELFDELGRHRRVTGMSWTELLRRHVLPELRPRLHPRALLAAVRRGARRQRSGEVPGGTPAYPPWIAPELADRVDLPEVLSRYTDVATPPLRGAFRRRRYQWLFMPMHLRWAVSHERRAAGFGLEAVDAWSDRRVAELCVAIPQQMMDVRSDLEKRLARRAMKGVMPESFRRGAGKVLPTPLFHETLRTQAAPVVRKLLNESCAEARGWIDPAPLRENFEAFVAGGRLRGEFWWAISLEWWLRVHESERANGHPAAHTSGVSGTTDQLPEHENGG